MNTKALSLAIALSALGSLGLAPAHAQEKTRAEVKAETKAAGVRGDASADAPTPGGKNTSGVSRAEVKAKTRAAGNLNDPTASYAPPGTGVKSTASRAAVKAETRAAGVRGDATAETPTPGPVKK